MLRGHATVAGTFTERSPENNCQFYLGYAKRLLLVPPCFERGFGAGLFERIRDLRRSGHIGGQRLYAQATVQIGGQQSAHPAHIFVAALHAIFASPESDYRHETRFMVCDHHETSSETGYFSKRPIDGGG